MENCNKNISRRLWVLSSPDSFLTPFFSAAINAREGDAMMSADVYRGSSPTDGDTKVTLVAYDPAKGQDVNSLHSIDNIVVLNVPTVHTPTVDYPGISRLEINTGYIIGTGMEGLPMQMLEAIDRGVYFNVKGMEPHLELVHADDVARCAINLGAEHVNTTINLHDGKFPAVSQLAEALAHRLNGKRIYTLSPRWHKFFALLTGTTSLYKAINMLPKEPSTLSADTPPCRDVIHYLLNHQYTTDDI